MTHTHSGALPPCPRPRASKAPNIMHQTFKAGLVAALLLAASQFAAAQTTEKKDLAWAFNKGDKSSYTLHWGLEIGQSIRGQQTMEMGTIKVNVAYTLDQEVTEVTEGVATIKGKIKSIKASTSVAAMGMPGPEETYDSEKPDGAGILKFLEKALDQEIVFKMKTTGEVTEVTGGEAMTQLLAMALAEEAQKAAPNGGGGGMPGMGGAQTAQMALIAFADASLKSALNMLNRVLPSEEAETWDIDHELKTEVGTMSFTGKYKFGEAATGKTRINFKNEGEVTMKKGEGAAGIQAMIKDLKVVDSKVKGLSTFGAGHILNSEVEFMADAEGEPAGMLKQRLEMMGGGKLGVKYGLKLRYERAGAKKSEF